MPKKAVLRNWQQENFVNKLIQESQIKMTQGEELSQTTTMIFTYLQGSLENRQYHIAAVL